MLSIRARWKSAAAALRLPAPFALLALAIPGLVALMVSKSTSQTIATIAITLTTLAAAVYVYRARPLRVLLHVLLVFIPIAVFYRAIYEGPVSIGVVVSVLETTWPETSELLSDHLLVTISLLCFLLVAFGTAAAAWWAHNPFSRESCIYLAIGALLALQIWAFVVAKQTRDQGGNLAWALKDSAREVFPIDMLLSTKILLRGRLETDRAASARTAFRFQNVHRAAGWDLRGAETYVVVIGEASRRANWSLYGYGRETTPRLGAQRSDLIVFDRAMANANMTFYSLGLSLTGSAPAAWSSATTSKSIISLLKQGGFSVYWISNQERYGLAENPVSALALEADSVSFASDYASSPHVARNPYDSNLLARIETVLQQRKPGQDIVIFLHMMGSHETYRDRYPKDFTVFQHAARSTDPRQEGRLRRLDEYDNSVRYTDFVLSSLINRLGQLGGETALIYFSDHGERVHDPEHPELSGHGFPLPSMQELEIPFFLWVSPTYRSEHPELVRALQANTHRRIQLGSLFDTIVDLTGVAYDNRRAAQSLFSPELEDLRSLQVLTPQQTPICVALADQSQEALAIPGALADSTPRVRTTDAACTH